MGFSDVLLVFIGLLIAFWGYGFVRLAVALTSGLWFGSLASLYVEEVLKSWSNALIGFLAGALTFIVAFILTLINYRVVGSVSLGFFATYLLYKYVTTADFLKPYLSDPNLVLTLLIAIFLLVTALAYMLFKTLIVLITSSLGTFLCYLGLTKLFPETPVALIACLAVFTLSLTLNLRKAKLK
ncbi:MAG: hypothetical protein B7O98_04875 [Zestosphaera tikiterensis]|uniref:DUF4203 domain-containing protein n=1 Tax=Zestosphaera tikiterensis TaxID=1973259 RepID=A0A2R7Y7D9_9CREN|nr:MAG: hypothetical protein B7O98_04875 [Zestosphaera tikiterensis]